MSYTQLLCHIVIRTKWSKEVISNEHSDSLYRFMWGYTKNKKCILHRINGMPDHIHLLVQFHPTVAVSDFVKELKTSSNKWIKESELFPEFEKWGEKYAALNYAYRDKQMIIEYIKNQREHHQKVSFASEFRQLLVENNIEIDEPYFLAD